MRGALITLAVLAMAAAGLSSVAARKAETHVRANTAGKRETLAPRQKVDINHASLSQLLTVPGLTSSWAGRIVRFRPYRAKNDLLERGVLPSDVYDHIRNYVIAHRVKKQN